MRGLFITGTDTGVGKTLVAAAIVRHLRQQGREVRISKPVATGAQWIDGRWLAEDTVRLAQSAADGQDLERITPWAFPDPVAPPVAARRQGTMLELSTIVAAVRNRYSPGSILIVEGAGGLLCPLTENETMADLAAQLGLRLVVVARRSLGTLNHTLLTLEAARLRGLAVAGVVISETTPPHGLAEETNVEELRRRVTVPILAVIEHQPDARGEVPGAIAQIDWWRLGD